MSRNFELLEQIERERSFGRQHSPEPKFIASERLRERDDKARWDGDDALGLVQRIFLPQEQGSPRVVTFAAVDHGNGCSRLCRSVAEALAKNASGAVCLLEGNFRSPGLPSLFGTANHYGLTDALQKEGPIRSFAKPVGPDNLWLLSSGALVPESPNLLTAERITLRLAESRSEFAYVIIDTPPVGLYGDAIVLGQLSDGMVLVLEAENTHRETALAVVGGLRSSKVRILGAVLNKRTFPIPQKLYDRL